MLPMLEDILYPNEKEILAEKYRFALDKIGEAIRNMPPKQKVFYNFLA